MESRHPGRGATLRCRGVDCELLTDRRLNDRLLNIGRQTAVIHAREEKNLGIGNNMTGS